MKQKNSQEEAKVLEVTRELTRMMIERYTEAMKDILDKNFTLTHITGYVQSREEWLGEIESERMKYYSAEEVKNIVKVYGDRAQFTGQNILDARIWGTRNNWRLQQKMKLEKRNEKWIILNSVASIF